MDQVPEILILFIVFNLNSFENSIFFVTPLSILFIIIIHFDNVVLRYQCIMRQLTNICNELISTCFFATPIFMAEIRAAPTLPWQIESNMVALSVSQIVLTDILVTSFICTNVCSFCYWFLHVCSGHSYNLRVTLCQKNLTHQKHYKFLILFVALFVSSTLWGQPSVQHSLHLDFFGRLRQYLLFMFCN